MSGHADMLAAIRLEQKLGGYAQINAQIPWRDRFSLLRKNYRIKQKMVEAGLDSWSGADVYEFADWDSLFTPIERSLWWDIRHADLPLWPQFPVGRYFVDFGNPVFKIAVECDGRDFHQDKAKDAARDADLRAMGWRVFRLEGWKCQGAAPEHDPEMTDDDLEQRAAFIKNKTPAALIAELKQLTS